MADLHRTGQKPGNASLIGSKTIFAKQKTRNAEHQTDRRLIRPVKGDQYGIPDLVAVVSMMALYALIIVGCLKQPEW